ncbi:MAG TPA: tRNA (guanosine(37)-N1)-methyltransferase TrmD [Nocardioidaceae bacterium]|nr:tRNA (guanosine(37)-N1)-methyltransferase TrmD [Nocardioidaceae bacterium]
MRIDVITIFPEYLAPLGLSLLGKARDRGQVDLRVHDLRDFTHDRHHTVDDAPYGGGPGMVMRPGPWGEAIDSLLAERPELVPGLVVPTPAGRRFHQSVAVELAARPWLVFACGRYEGIDQRVVDHYRKRLDVYEVSLGDFVTSGGEVAALAVIEAVARLVPGVVGNAESLTEESHTAGELGGLLEYPVYTRPTTWRGLDVPAVLLSGHHGEIRAWRRAEARRRTASNRPDLLDQPRTGA